MRIELTPWQMAVLAQVFARDRENLKEIMEEIERRPFDATMVEIRNGYINILQTRLWNQETLRQLIDMQLKPQDQRNIMEQAKREDAT